MAPYNWISHGKCVKFGIFSEIQRRTQKRGDKKAWMHALSKIVDHDYNTPEEYSAESWPHELYYVRLILKEYHFDDDLLTVLAQLLLQALEVPRNCARDLNEASKEKHKLIFFTNYRASQVYCCHNKREEKQVEDLVNTSINFRFPPRNREYRDLKYHEYTETLFFKVAPYLAWECIFPEGIDMEALSPRDANAHLRKQPPAKLKAPVAKVVGKEKDHPPPPPSDVIEPPSFDRKHGATFRTGDLLGRGGFAICYKARLAGTRDVYALKIVKSKMQQKKMEQKVNLLCLLVGIPLTVKSSKPSSKSTPK